jgi:type VI secretion system ImpM family protein
MPDARPLTGLFGKVPAHGDFVRRGLPSSFVGPWDAWLQEAVAAARDALGPRWADAWDAAPPWRFALPAGACGPDAVAGVMLPSVDTVGRRFPVTLAALLAPGEAMPGPAWFERVEAVACAGRAGVADADALCAAIPDPAAPAESYPPPPAGVVGEGLPFATQAEDAGRMAWTAANMPAAPFWAAADGAPGAAGGDDVLAILTGAGAAPEVRDDAGGSSAQGDAPASGQDGAFIASRGDVAPPLYGAGTAPGDGGVAGTFQGDVPAPFPGDALVPFLGDAPAPLSSDGPALPRDDALSLLLGGAGPAPDAAAQAGAAPDAIGLLLGGGGGQAGEKRDAIAPPALGAEADDPLAALIGAGRQGVPDAFAPAPPLAEAPDPLAALIGAGAAAGPPGDTADLLAPMPDPVEPGDPLGALIAAGAGDAPPAGMPAADPFPPFAFEPADPPDASRADSLVPEPAAPPPAPPAPETGGWWTRGAAHLPPMVWALPALPAPSDFACLLEAHA